MESLTLTMIVRSLIQEDKAAQVELNMLFYQSPAVMASRAMPTSLSLVKVNSNKHVVRPSLSSSLELAPLAAQTNGALLILTLTVSTFSVEEFKVVELQILIQLPMSQTEMIIKLLNSIKIDRKSREAQRMSRSNLWLKRTTGKGQLSGLRHMLMKQ